MPYIRDLLPALERALAKFEYARALAAQTRKIVKM